MLSQQDIFLPMTQMDILGLNSQQKPILKSVFGLNGTSVLLLLTDSFIILTEKMSSNVMYCCQLNFSVKFEVIRAEWQNEKTPGKPLGICLEKEDSQYKIEFLSTSPEIVSEWTKELEKRINQRNFHKLFKAKRKIGKGAFATVYLAQRLIDETMVAVKAFSKEKQYAGDKGRESLQNQIKIMRILNNQNIMKLEGIYETENSIYVILEYLQGVQLNQEIKNQRRFSLEETKTILRGLLNGISHLSSKRIIHRDLKPENIMFRKKNSLQIAICDFGLATHADEEKYLFVRCGTPGFVAPEIINIKDMSLKSETISDVFSAGIIFHYLLLNKSIFEGTKYGQILAQNRACDFNFNKQEYFNLDPQAFDLLTRMLDKRPEFRITPDKALNHSFLAETQGEMMDIEQIKEPQYGNLFKEKDIETVETPSTFKSDRFQMSLRKKRSSPPLNRDETNFDSYYSKIGNKENFPGLVPMKKTVSSRSQNTRSKGKTLKNQMIDEIYEHQ